LKNGAELNPKNSEGWTPMHFAAKKSDETVILLLIDLGADFSSQTNSGKIPADYANSKVRHLFDPDGKNKTTEMDLCLVKR